jgi:predicted PurR-regulated permease PerM
MPNTDDERSMTALVQDFLRRIRGLLVLVIVGALLYFLQGIAQLLLVATLVAYILNPLVSRLQGRMSRTRATLIVFALLVAGMVGAGMLVGPVVEQQVQDVRASVDPDQITMVIQEVDAQLNDLSATLGGGEVRFEERVDQKVKAWTTGVVNMAPGLLGLITNVILVPFMAVFLLRDGPRIKRGLIRFVPNRYFEFSLEALHKIDIQLGNYFRGLVLEISIVSVLSIASLWILGVPAYVLVGLLAGITTVIPYAGSLLGGSIGILIKLASTGSISAAALVLVAFLAIQIADEALIQPLVFAQAVDLHPLEVLIAVWVAAQFFGVVGMVLAIPVTSAGKVVVAEGGALIQQYQFS